MRVNELMKRTEIESYLDCDLALHLRLQSFSHGLQITDPIQGISRLMTEKNDHRNSYGHPPCQTGPEPGWQAPG